jgi:hypothetical protein
MRKPLNAAFGISFQSNTFSPLIAAQTRIINPAMMNLTAPSINGGNPPRAPLIKKYVDPQTMYTTAKATITASLEG